MASTLTGPHILVSGILYETWESTPVIDNLTDMVRVNYTNPSIKFGYEREKAMHERRKDPLGRTYLVDRSKDFSINISTGSGFHIIGWHDESNTRRDEYNLTAIIYLSDQVGLHIFRELSKSIMIYLKDPPAHATAREAQTRDFPALYVDNGNRHIGKEAISLVFGSEIAEHLCVPVPFIENSSSPEKLKKSNF